MPSFDYVIDERERAGSRFLAHVRDELQRALVCEKAEEQKAGRKLTQQSIADKLGVNRSVVNRHFMGLENLTAKKIGELLWAIGWEPRFEAVRIEIGAGENECSPPQLNSPNIVVPTIAATTSGQNMVYEILSLAQTAVPYPRT